MAFLKAIGWLFVPYIMIFFQWKKIGNGGKVVGTIWALICVFFIVNPLGGDDEPIMDSPAEFVATSGTNTSSNATETTQTTPTPTPKPTPTPEPKKPNLEVIDHKVEHDDFISYIVGTVKNNTNKKYSYVQVEVNLYDEDGAQVGSTLDNLNNLEAGGTWKFKAVILADGDIASYKIVDVSGW